MGKSGRGKGRGGKSFKSHTGRGKGSNTNKSESSDNKKVEQYVFYVGSNKQASNCDQTAEYPLNHIREEHGSDIYLALKSGKDFDFSTIKPATVTHKTLDAKEGAYNSKADNENDRLDEDYDIECKQCISRREQCRVDEGSAFALNVVVFI